MAKPKARPRKSVTRTVELDTATLFDGNMEDAISYLRMMRKEFIPDGVEVMFHQGWYGYEDNFFQLVWYSPETDKEYNARIAEEDRVAADLKKKQKIDAEKLRLVKQKENIDKKLRNLR